MITEENAQKMMDDLVRLCDNIERYGLVDYQYGVWEEQIAASKFIMSPGLCHAVVRHAMLTVRPNSCYGVLGLLQIRRASGSGGWDQSIKPNTLFLSNEQRQHTKARF